jgi:hypothetical protein
MKTTLPLMTLILIGCNAPGAKYSLAEIKDDVHFGLQLVIEDDHITQLLVGETGDLPLKLPEACLFLGSEAKARLNGEELPAQSLGEWTDNGCMIPEWAINDTGLRSQPTLSLEISDATATLHADFVNVNAQRTFEITSPTTGTAHPGDTVTVRLHPEIDNQQIIQAVFDVAGAPISWLTVDAATATASFQVPERAYTDHLVLAEDGLVGTSRCDFKNCELPLVTSTPPVELTVRP